MTTIEGNSIMPMNRALYPANWGEIASAIKKAAAWHCQWCGKACYQPGERVVTRRLVLTVHHLDGNPGNCDAGNLVALCAPCHLRADRDRRRLAAFLTEIMKG